MLLNRLNSLNTYIYFLCYLVLMNCNVGKKLIWGIFFAIPKSNFHVWISKSTCIVFYTIFRFCAWWKVLKKNLKIGFFYHKKGQIFNRFSRTLGLACDSDECYVFHTYCWSILLWLTFAVSTLLKHGLTNVAITITRSFPLQAPYFL